MKKLLPLLLIFVLALSFSGCYQNHYEYTDINDYSKIKELYEIREKEAIFDIIPEDIEKKDIEKFYFSWDLGFIGSASVQIQCSVKYSEKDLKNEVERIKSIEGSEPVKRKIKKYNTFRFVYPAYVSVLGYDDTNCYALIDKESRIIHYIYLSLTRAEDMKIDAESLTPEGYKDNGEVLGESFTIYNYE